MTGIEILTTTEVATEYGFCWGIFWGIVAAAIIITVFICSFEYFSGECDASIYIVLFPMAFIGVIFGIVVGAGAGEPKEYETQYKVTISDEVNFNEFVEKYEVIEQDGKIYTVREKETINE